MKTFHVPCVLVVWVFTSLCQQWALQWGLCGSFYFEQPPSSSWAWLSSLEHVCQLHIGKRITMPLDSAMIEIIVVRLELAKLVQVGLGQIETVEHSWLTQTNCLNSSCLTATICHSWEEQIWWSVLASRLARGSCCKKKLISSNSKMACNLSCMCRGCARVGTCLRRCRIILYKTPTGTYRRVQGCMGHFLTRCQDPAWVMWMGLKWTLLHFAKGWSVLQVQLRFAVKFAVTCHVWVPSLLVDRNFAGWS